MAGEKRFKIVETRPTVYNDRAQGVINGYLTTFNMTDYDEIHEVRTPKLDAATITAAIEAALKERDALAG